MFLSQRGSSRSQMAKGFAKLLVSPESVNITNVGCEAGALDPRAIQVMSEVGIDISDQPHKQLADLNASAVDLVIALSESATLDCSVLPGAPALVRWDVPDPTESSELDELSNFRRVRDIIKRRVEDFFAGGYLPALVAQKHNSEIILDHFSDGIIAHDLNRRITWFNRAAERITGYSRREVIGHDCHDIFADGFCRGKCSFCDNTHLPLFEKLQYSLNITAKDGQVRRVEMSVVPMKNDKGVFQGVLASFHDITEVTQLRRRLKDVHSFHGIIGADDKMQLVYELISDLAASDCPVLIQGESGTGKELIANAIHEESRRAGRPFVTVNCGALPEGVLESELFGHVRGAFTGAVRDRKGRFELADGGTLFLDEVAELTPNMQVKLLRVLQEGTFQQVGGEKTVRVDVRVVSATNYDLRERVRQGQFREDLFYRLCVVPINLPPLRERRNDIPLLLNHFLERISKDQKVPIRDITQDALRLMIDYPWPGNIREMQNAIQYAFVKCKENTLSMEYLPPEILESRLKSHLTEIKLPSGTQIKVSDFGRKIKLNLETVINALKAAKGSKVKAAKKLGVGRATLYRFIKRYGLAEEELFKIKSRKSISELEYSKVIKILKKTKGNMVEAAELLAVDHAILNRFIEKHGLAEEELFRVKRRKSKNNLDYSEVIKVLEKTNGNKIKAADLLGVGRATLYRFLKEHGTAGKNQSQLDS